VVTGAADVVLLLAVRVDAVDDSALVVESLLLVAVKVV
jgi:hypothetical protein